MQKRPFNDHSYEEFLSEGRIMGSKCLHCGSLALPPRPICTSCLKNDMEWFEFQGYGTIAAFTSISVAPPSFARQGFGRNNPYVVGVVELKEGPKVVARITGIDAKRPDEISLGIPVKADIIPKSDAPAALIFRAAK